MTAWLDMDSDTQEQAVRELPQMVAVELRTRYAWADEDRWYIQDPDEAPELDLASGVQGEHLAEFFAAAPELLIRSYAERRVLEAELQEAREGR